MHRKQLYKNNITLYLQLLALRLQTSISAPPWTLLGTSVYQIACSLATSPDTF